MSRNNYKCKTSGLSMQAKKGQVAIFVIIAIVIVGAILLIFLYPKIPILSQNSELSPVAYLKSCITPEINKDVLLLSKNGGYANPEGVLDYQGDKIKYLCYTSEYYKTCVVQQPLIKEHFEQELNTLVHSKVNDCVQSLKQEYINRGYDITLGNIESKTSINPDNILVSITSPITVSKAGASQTFNGFDVQIGSKMYDMLMITVSIIDYESTLGDSETTLYLQYYPDLKIEKVKFSDGSKVYTLTDVVSDESFRFASRSLAWPPGYGGA